MAGHRWTGSGAWKPIYSDVAMNPVLIPELRQGLSLMNCFATRAIHLTPMDIAGFGVTIALDDGHLRRLSIPRDSQS